jgi:DNA polymerase-3 subunit chi
MTEVLFYMNAADKLHAACQLSSKALSRKMRVMILTPEAQVTDKLSRLLWTTPALAFNPHCRAADRLAPVTPIIVDHATDPVVHEEVLINLRTDMPSYFSRFSRVVEIVTQDADDRALARDRYRFYRDRGYEITTHDLGKDKS